MKRVLTALVLVPILIAIIGYAPPFYFFLLVCAASVLALEEYFSLATQSGLEVFRIAGHGSSILLVASLYGFRENLGAAMIVLVASCLLLFALGLRRGTSLPTVLPGVAGTVLGLLYVSLTLGIASGCPLICNDFGTREKLDFLSPAGGLVRRHRCLLCGPCLG